MSTFGPYTIPDTTKGSTTTTTTTPTSTTVEHRDDLPSEAMAFNGDFFEDKIEGYQTLYVKGRESMLAEINAYETGVRDGAGITSKRFPARELVIGYLLHAKSNEAFRDAYNQLNAILNTQDAQVIFNDEVDKFFTGTPNGLDEIEAGRNFVQGEIIIYCADPYKYSTEEKVVSAQKGTTTATYSGTVRAYPRLEADFGTDKSKNNDCGFVSWYIYTDASDGGKLIMLGNEEETDEGEFYRSETLYTRDFTTYSSVSEALSGWTQNYDIYVNTTASLWNGMNGTFRIEYGVNPQYFYNEASGKWTGVSFSLPFPADSSGETGATTWKISWVQDLNIGTGGAANSTRGGIQCIISDGSKNVIAAANMYKGAYDSGSTGQLSVHTLNQKTTKTNIDMSKNNKYWGTAGSCYISKSGSTVTFNLGGLVYSLTDSGITDMKATRVTFVLLQRSEYSTMVERIRSVEYKKSNVSYWKDVSNTFGRNDVAIADCTDGKVYLNGAENASIGNIENNWESFCLVPGDNQIRFNCSDWCENEPTTKIFYREVYL